MKNNIIVVDFRYNTRREEMEAIIKRASERLNYFALHSTLTEAQRKQSKVDSEKSARLRLEAAIYKDTDFLEKYNQ